MPYYHLSGGRFGAGSIVEPGNFGRIIRLHSWSHNLAIREMALEAARVACFPNMPSRLDSCFGFVSLDEAQAFRAQINGFQTHLLYRVSIEGDAPVIGLTDSRMCGPNGALRHDWADAYWEGMTLIEHGADVAEGTLRELLTLSPLRIEERID
jgi:hypothetical protein